MKIRYTSEELEVIDQLYVEQFPYKDIAEEVNKNIHGGKSVRTTRSIEYALNMMYRNPRCLDLRMHE